MTEPRVRPDSEQLRAFEELMHYEGAAAFAAGPEPWVYWNNGDPDHAWPENIEAAGHRHALHARTPPPPRPLGQRLLATLTHLTLLVLAVGIAGVWLTAREEQQQLAQGVQPVPIGMEGSARNPAWVSGTDPQLAQVEMADIERLPAPAAGPGEQQSLDVISTVDTPVQPGETTPPAGEATAPLFAPPSPDELWGGQINTTGTADDWQAPPVGLDGVLPFEPEPPAEYSAPGTGPQTEVPELPGKPQEWAPAQHEMEPAETVTDMPTADAGDSGVTEDGVMALNALPSTAAGGASAPVAASGMTDSVDAALPQAALVPADNAAVEPQAEFTPVDSTAHEPPPPPFGDAADTQPASDELVMNIPAVEDTPPAPRAAVAPVSAVASSDAPQWVVNLAAYNSEAMAQRVQDKFRKEGVETELFHVSVNGRDMIRLRTTGLDSYQEAADWSAMLEQRLGLSGTWVSKR